MFIQNLSSHKRQREKEREGGRGGGGGRSIAPKDLVTSDISWTFIQVYSGLSSGSYQFQVQPQGSGEGQAAVAQVWLPFLSTLLEWNMFNKASINHLRCGVYGTGLVSL